MKITKEEARLKKVIPASVIIKPEDHSAGSKGLFCRADNKSDDITK